MTGPVGHLGCVQEAVTSDQCSELVEISKLNGDFGRNYGKLLGRYSLSALRQRRAAVLGFGPAWFPSLVLASQKVNPKFRLPQVDFIEMVALMIPYFIRGIA